MQYYKVRSRQSWGDGKN